MNDFTTPVNKLLAARKARACILTKAEAEQDLNRRHIANPNRSAGVMHIRSLKYKAVFFTNEYNISSKDFLNLDKSWVSGSSAIPHDVVPRVGLEDGYIQTIDDLLLVYYLDNVLIENEADLRKHIAKIDGSM